MKRAIVTGGTGAVGSALVRELVNKKIEVLVFCREGSERNSHIPEGKLVKKRFCSLDQLAMEHNDTGREYDVFYHLAWEGTTGTARDDMYLQNQNVRYALDAVATAKRFGCHTFIGAGSQAEYGRIGGVLRPETPTFPETGYGIAKLCAGQMTREYAHKLGMKHIWMRILSVYGPNDGGQSMVMSTIRKIKNKETPQFTKGEQKWDYLYSEDAARAFRLVGEKGIDGKIYVLGSGKVRPLSEYIKDIGNIIDSGMEMNIGAIPYSERQVMYLCADISELENDTGWNPKVSFQDGIKAILATYKK